MERIMIQLERESLNDLDEVAAARGVSRSAVVRDLLGDALAEERRKSELARVIDVLGRSPADDDVVVPGDTRRSAWPS
ncbi:MAG: ribbon-helix-helix protein, CopG family [Actinomycetota bacterium]|nr:ribbon-helix-helix protein, CopG family [Actinomycetota bacterium]